MKSMMKSISVWLPIIISLIALIISIFSYRLSERTYEYEKSRDMLIYTPSIKESVDSLDISFTLNADNAELQGMTIIFPCDITNNPVSINTKPIRLSKISMEILAEQIVSKYIKPTDSIESVGVFSIPVMIDYSSIVYGFPQSLRENRLLMFNIFCDDYLKVTYSNSYLINKCTFPLKQHYFYTGPFASSLEGRVRKQDEEDVQELLKEQLEQSLLTLKCSE